MPRHDRQPWTIRGLATLLRTRAGAVYEALRKRFSPDPPDARADTKPDEPVQPPTSTPRRRREQRVDRTLDSSFPASDPPSWTATGSAK